MQRQAAINNPTFLNEQDIGKAVYDWTIDITKNMEAKQAVLVYRRKHPCVYTTVNLRFYFFIVLINQQLNPLFYMV